MTEVNIPSEYGRILISKRDGSDGAVFGLMKDIKIGRDKDSDIRVNIPSVSRDHVRIYKDENGECNIQNVSGTNVTTVNGQTVENFLILKDGDVFCVGLRQFTYQNGDKKTLSDKVNCDLVGRHIPLMESSDENQTLDFAKHPSLNIVRGKPLTPIQETSNEGLSPNRRILIAAESIKVASKGPVNIEAVSATTVTTAERIQIPKRERAQSPGGSLKKMNVSTIKQMNATVREAIQKRRSSYCAAVPVKSPNTNKGKTSRRISVENSLLPIDQAPIESNTSLLQVINARRKSLDKDSLIALAEKEHPAPVDCGVQTPSKMLVANALTASKPAETETVPSVFEGAAEQSFETAVSPLRQAINARRRSSLSFPESSVPLVETAVAAPDNVKRDHTLQFTSSTITRRVSVGVRTAPAQQTSKMSKRKSIAAPHQTESARLHVSRIVAELAVDEDVSVTCTAANRKSILSLPQDKEKKRESLAPSLNTPVKASEDRVVVLKQALCVQLAVDAFASELEMQGVPAGIAYATAIDTYLSNPSAFGIAQPVSVSSRGPRRRESLLASLEKKAEPTGRSIFGASGDDALVSCDLISALTDSDMDIIDSYAMRLTDTMGGDAEEAYAIALDAFVRGVEQCHKEVTVIEEPVSVVSEPSSVLEVEVAEPVMMSGCELPPVIMSTTGAADDNELSLGASLRCLFDLPSDYQGRDEADDDEKLVSRYAEDLREDACIDAAVAYGIALDTFLADPVAFRFHIGGVKSRLMELRSPLRTPEIDYDYYYQDDYHSACKSTEKKVVQPPSNSHIYFTSPMPGATPVKMSPLCEMDDDDEAVLAVEMPEVAASPSPVRPSSAAASMAAAAVRREQEQVASPASESPAVPDRPATPSTACFREAFSVIKSAKKSPFISRKSTPGKVLVECGTPQEKVTQEAVAVAEVAAVFVPEEIPMVVEAEVEVECAPEVQEPSVEQAPSTPKKVQEPWMASAAASLKKSLPPLSAKKSPFKSAKKAKVPTPRQSRLSIKPSDVINSANEPAAESEDTESCVVVNITEVLDEVKGVALDATSSVDEVMVPETVFQDQSVAECCLPEESVIVIVEESVPAPMSVSLSVTPCELTSSTPKRSVRSRAAKSAVKVAIAQEVAVDMSATVSELPVRVPDVSEVQVTVSECAVEETICARDVAPEVSVDFVPVVEEVVSVECVPVVEEVVSVECVSAVEEVVSVECVSAVEEVVSVECVPAVEEVVSVVEIALVGPTPSRVTRSKISTPTVTVSTQGAVVAVVAPRSSRRSCVTTAAVKSEKAVVEQTEAIFPVSFESEGTAPEEASDVSLPEASAAKGRGKRMSVAATKPAEAPSAMKRSRRGQGIELDSTIAAAAESSNAMSVSDVPAAEIVAQIAPIEEPVSVVKPTPARSSRKVQPAVVAIAEDLKSASRSRGRPPRGVKQAIELEDDKEEEEEEEEEALALLCDGCDAEHFLDDLGLESIPEGDWFCGPCVAMKESVAVSSVKTSVKVAKGSTPSKSRAEVTEAEVCVKASASRKRVAEVVEPSSALEGRRSARLH